MTVKHYPQSGFSLIELIIVIVITGILATMTTSVLELPIQAYVDSSRRATLTSVADSAMRNMQRDIRRALPNSIRISPDQTTIEFLQVVTGGRYRARLNTTVTPPTGDILDFSIADTSMDIVGQIPNFADVTLNSDQLVVFPLNSAGNDPYQADNITLITGGDASNLAFDAFQFPTASPDQRFFIISQPITYRCNNTAATADKRVIERYTNYAIQANQPLPPTVTPAIQANLIANCQFSYNSGSNTRLGVVTIELTLTDDAGESVNLIHQVQVDNQP